MSKVISKTSLSACKTPHFSVPLPSECTKCFWKLSVNHKSVCSFRTLLLKSTKYVPNILKSNNKKFRPFDLCSGPALQLICVDSSHLLFRTWQRSLLYYLQRVDKMSEPGKKVKGFSSSNVTYLLSLCGLWFYALEGCSFEIQANFTVYGRINRHKKPDHNLIPFEVFSWQRGGWHSV